MGWPRALVDSLIVAGACVALVGCGSRRNDAATESTAPARSATAALADATTVAHADVRLARVLASAPASDRGWSKSSDADESFRSSAASPSGAHAHALDARIGSHGTAPLAIDLHEGATGQVSLRLDGARDVTATLSDGALVFPAALGTSVDRVVTRSATEVEELLLLRDAQAPAAFSWSVDLPPSVPNAVRDGHGGLSFRTASGRDVLFVAAPYAVDAHGVHRPAELGWDQAAHRLTVHLDSHGLVYPVLLDPSFSTAGWTLVTQPGRRDSTEMAYDPVHQQVVLFSGQLDSPVYQPADTWTWDGKRWTQQSPATSPPAREAANLTYDSTRERVVLFGGWQESTGLYRADTWTWDGVSWTAATPTQSPPARGNAMMAFDQAHQQMVLFGGRDQNNDFLNDTWLWDGSDWTQIKTGGAPDERSEGAMFYDQNLAQVVLFGGYGDAGYLGDMWSWDGTGWTQVATTGALPSPRSRAGAFYDTKRKREVLFSGLANGTLDDTWAWDGHSWAQIGTVGPTEGYTDGPAASAYDAAADRGIVEVDDFGDVDPPFWTFDGTQWTGLSTSVPVGRLDGVLVTDPVRRQTLLFAGEAGSAADLDDTWLFDGATWTEVTPTTSPSGRQYVGGAYDPVHGDIVVFGGFQSSTGKYLNDTWLWNGTTWAQITTTTAPSVRCSYGMAWDDALQKVVLYGGWDGKNDHGDTWEWDGASWTQITTASSPGLRDSFAFAYDTVRQRMVLFSGGGPTAFSDTWTFDGTNWSQISTTNPPHFRLDAGFAWDAVDQVSVLFGGAENGTFFGDTWVWDGAGWTQIGAPTAPTARGYLRMAPSPLGDGLMLFSGINANAVFDDTWLFRATGGGCTSGSQCDSGYCVDGTCCGTPSCGTCQTCNGATPGSCSWAPAGDDPDSCQGASTCNATGVCLATNGATCQGAGDCASGFCVDGVCCNTACNGTCEACSATAKTTGASGVCGLAASGKDPHDDCSASGDCGLDGTCDGSGACRITLAGVSCGASQCDDNRAIGRVCDGLGACTQSATGVECAPYICSTTAGGCSAPCSADTDCLRGSYCDAGTCRTRKTYGAACTTSSECALGGSCADGVCCNDACTGQCEACNELGTEGTCVPVVGAPRAGRPACATSASGSDTCQAASCNGVVSASCEGFVGPNVSCRAASCADGVATLAGSCTGKGSCQELITVNCTPYACAGDGCAKSCASDTDCNARFRCDATSKTCVTRTEATCDGDHTLTAPDGTTTSCAPYRCSGSVCTTSCSSIESCAPGFVCNTGGACVTASAASSDDGGCSVGRAGDRDDGSGALAWIGGALVMTLTRRRRARRDAEVRS